MTPFGCQDFGWVFLKYLIRIYTIHRLFFLQLFNSYRAFLSLIFVSVLFFMFYFKIHECYLCLFPLYCGFIVISMVL